MTQKTILLVEDNEDNEDDIMLLREAFEELAVDVKLDIVRDGEKALHYLHKREEYLEESMPDLILLDINIPKVSGLEVVKKLKKDKSTRIIPVIMLTTSSSEKDIKSAYSNYANSYIVKPDDAESLSETVSIIDEFWFHYSALPTR